MTNATEASAFSLEPPRGMRDFYPADMALRNAVFDAWTRSARKFAFQQYDACVVESLALLTRKAGEEISDQIYAFQDKSGRGLALRPEMTPTLARMIAAREGALQFPLKWFAIAQCFRYERMSRGRKREHFQWNLDVIGEPGMAAEAEILACALCAIELLGLANKVLVRFSSRALLGELLARSGIDAQHHNAVFLALDKRGKIPDSEVAAMLVNSGVPSVNIDSVFALLALQSLDQAAAMVSPDSQPLRDIKNLLELLDAAGIAGQVCFDLSVVRGLGYYTGIVFEAFDIERKFRAVFGGGRYDSLISSLGGTPRTAVGLGFGDVVIAELLADQKCLPSDTPTADIAIGFMEAAQQPLAIRLAATLRRQGRDVDLALRPEKAKHFFSRTGKGAFNEAAYLGPDDVAAGVARIKKLADRAEYQIPLNPTHAPEK